MPADAYTSFVSGGLKLKGVPPRSSRISKPHHPKHRKPATAPDPTSARTGDADADGKSPPAALAQAEGVKPADSAPETGKEARGEDAGTGTGPSSSRPGKTEAELRHEERRWKKVCPHPRPASQVNGSLVTEDGMALCKLNQRLKREGTKTHKERVEDLNRYLSNLSEHHDMYVPLCAAVGANGGTAGAGGEEAREGAAGGTLRER